MVVFKKSKGPFIFNTFYAFRMRSVQFKTIPFDFVGICCTANIDSPLVEIVISAMFNRKETKTGKQNPSHQMLCCLEVCKMGLQLFECWMILNKFVRPEIAYVSMKFQWTQSVVLAYTMYADSSISFRNPNWIKWLCVNVFSCQLIFWKLMFKFFLIAIIRRTTNIHNILAPINY